MGKCKMDKKINLKSLIREIVTEIKINESQLLATSGNEQGIVKLIKEFWYSTNISLVPTDVPDVWDVHNAKGKVNGFRVIKVKNKYRFEKI
jgi:hypothetical protein